MFWYANARNSGYLLSSLFAHDGVGGLEAVLEALHEGLALLVGHGAVADLLRLHRGHAVPVLVRLVVNWNKVRYD